MQQPGDPGWLDSQLTEPAAPGHPTGGRPPVDPGPSRAMIGAQATAQTAVRLPREKLRLLGRGTPTRDAENRQRVQAAVAFHIGGKLPGIEWTRAVDPISDRFLELAGDNPQMIAALEADVNTLFALTDEQLAAKIARGEPIGQFGDFFDSIAEVAWEVGADELAARANAERADAIKGTFDALTMQEAMSLALEDPGPVAPGGRFGIDQAKGQAFQTLFDVAGAWSYSPTARTLAVTVGDQTIGIETRPGFDPENHLDVMAEVVAAQADGRILGGGITGGQGEGNIQKIIDRAHEIGGWLDEHPEVRTHVDALWNVATLPLRGPQAVQDIAGQTGPLERSSDRIRDEKGQITEESVRLMSAVPFPEDAMIASIARLFVEDSAGTLTSKDALAMAADTVQENREQLVSEFESLTQEELIEQLEADIEGQSSLGGALESSLGGVLKVMEGYDQFTQWIGVNVIDALRDTLEAGIEFGQGDPAEGFTRLKNVFETEEFGTTAADYFGLENGAADAANLAVGIGFDPLNFLLPGSKGIRALARRALTEPKYAGIYLRMGAFPHVAKEIAEGVGAKAVRNVAAMSGLGDDEIVDLIRIAMDPEGTVGQVNEVWTRALNKDWLGEGPGRAIRHSTIEGLGRTLESIAGGHLADEHLDTVMKMFAKLSVGRTFKLGENQALDNFADLLTQFFPADKDRFSGWFLRAVEQRAASGDSLAMAGASQAMKEQARRAVADVGGPTSQMLATADPRAVNQNLRAVEDALTKLDTQGFDEASAAAVRSELERMHRVMSRRVDDARPRLAALQDQTRHAQKQLVKATALEADQAANASRNVMGDLVYRLYDEIATDLNTQFGREVVPVLPGRVNALAPDVPVRDWSLITGTPKKFVGGDEDLGLMMGLSVDDADMARSADAVGMFNRSQKVVLPASPYEVLLFQKLGHDDGLIQRASQVLRNEWLKKFSKGIRFVFGANLLLNPLTAGKVTLDETLRFLADTGAVGKFAHATAAGLPLVGGPVDDLIRRIPKVHSKYTETVVNPWALQYKRNVGGWSADDFADYDWVVRPPRRTKRGEFGLREYREQVERWVNGTLLNDRRFREYARWVDQAQVLADGTKIPPREFVDWWEHGAGLTRPGKADARTVTVTVRDEAMLGTDLTASDAFNILDNVFSHWLDLVVDQGRRPAMRKELLRAARGERGVLDVKADAQLLNSVSQVPGLSGKTGAWSKVFNTMFGAPSGRRAGVFYESYFDEAMQLLKGRHGDRVLTVDKVMEFANVDRQTAQFWMKEGSDNAVVSQLVSDQGMRIEAQLAARAAAYAERRADDLMYRFTSASMVGRGVEAGLLMPFARAQTDFLSWWSEYMFKPMTTRYSMESRAKFGPIRNLVTKANRGVERIPINLRAWAKYAHLVSAVNNDEPSIIDQAIENLTFFPFRFGSEILLKIEPQFGPLPSWMFDLMVDRGMISPEAQANVEAAFPALAFTELEDDPFEDIFNRVLPNSRRSLRDLSLGGVRAMYHLVGRDVHTEPGLAGTLANILADNKLPFATVDFQTALAADLLKENVWDLVPGSAEWDAAIRDIAIQGAVEANRQEWGQDFVDRVWPLAGLSGESRALRAFGGLFDEERFGAMAQAGLFQANDLLEDEEGVPRIRAAWARYEAGTATPEEMDWLEDRLHTVYFDAGRVEVLPGFSYLDYLNLTNPELAVNLINKSEDSGIPVRTEEHAEFKARYVNALTGRIQNVPPGEEGKELIAEARDKGWLVSRPVEEWAQDASEAVYKSGQRAVRGVWESVSHRTWQQGLKKSIEEKRFRLGGREALILEKAGLDVEAGTEYSYGEFHELLDTFDERFDVAQPVLADSLERGAVHGQLSLHNDAFGVGLLEDLAEADREFSKLGIESVEDWPEASKAEVRRLFSEAVTLGYTTETDYAQEIEPLFGPLNYEPPVPPPVEDLETGINITGDELGDLAVIDGDTVSLLLEDGDTRIRFIGINAPEPTQPGYAEARSNLQEVIEGASEVTIGIYKPELFGLTQLSAPGERRLLAWLYIDGHPLFDASVFTASNPRGAGVGGNVVDLPALLEAGRR